MASRRMGVVRESMLTNPLIMKAPLGQTMSRGLFRPDPDFIFGTSKIKIKEGGVAEVLTSWSAHTAHPALSAPPPPNIVALNRDAVKSGMVTAKEVSEYRAQRAMFVGQDYTPKPRKGQRSQSRQLPDITFGVATCRSSSPLSDLLSHQYGRRWIDEQLNRNLPSNDKEQQRLRARVKPGSIPDTRTSLLRRSQPLPFTETPFKLLRFTQVGPALDTFRTQQARRRAMGSYASEPSSGPERPEESDPTGPEEENVLEVSEQVVPPLD
ncbi:cilia- and flagella-associated protein 77 isoform X2 [Nelusetta ayraudi]